MNAIALLKTKSATTNFKNLQQPKSSAMKNKFSFIVVLLLTIIYGSTAHAQWKLPGNSNATTTSKLGTTNAIPLRLTTNNATRIYIDASTGNAGIGTGDAASSSYKLQVTGSAYGIYGSASTYGIFGNGSYGVYGNGTNYGVYGYSSSNYGVYGYGSTGVYGSGITYGVLGYSSGYYGLYGTTVSGSGVYGYSSTYYGGNFHSNSSYGIRAGTSTGYYAAVFDGNVYAYGSYYSSSDKNLKKNIVDVDNAMSIINKLKPKNYEFKTDDTKFTSFNLPKGRHYGLIAQEVQQILPNIVKETPQEINMSVDQPVIPQDATGKDGGSVQQAPKPETKKKETMNLMGVNYTELIPIMIKGMQEQDAKIEALTQLVNQLQSQQATAVASNTSSATAATLSNASIDQNIPNPLSNSTTIRYNIPANSTKAQLVVNDNSGNTVKQIQLANKGNGTVTLETSQLSSGTYSYTLFVDGKVIETRKMVIVR